MKKKPYGIYLHDSKWEEKHKGVWKLHRCFDSVEKAIASLKDLCKTPKKERSERYLFLPVRDSSERFIKVNDELINQFLDMGK